MWTRKPVVAGSFYPSNPKRITDEIDGYLNAVERKELDGELIGLISPHAGYVYSGPVAAYSYNQLKDSDAQIAIVLAPSHRARFNGASVIPAGIYETPLGGVDIDEVLGEKLVAEPHFTFLKDAHNGEHSLEVQVPFLQRALTDFKIVPVIIGVTDIDACRVIAEEISKNLSGDKRRFIIIISTDLSHYHSYEMARKMDGIFAENLSRFDEQSVYDALTGGKAEACGQGPVLTGLIISKKMGARKIEILKYANSGDTAGGKDQVVGYLSAAVLK